MDYRGCRPVETAFPTFKPAGGSASSEAEDLRPSSSPSETVAEPVGPLPSSPPSLASLLDQARAAQAELAGQPLPITNHHHRFLMNLFGG